MQRLTGLDDGFLWMETPTSYMHVASLIVVEGHTAHGPLDFEQVRALYESRLDYAPPFRRRLVSVPFGIHHPLWIEDPDFSLDWHLRHITLPSGHGDIAALTDLAAKLVAIPLDRTRPLWEMWFIDGIDDGHIGLLTKVHHAAIDGASGEELMVAILDLEPDPEPRPELSPPWSPDPVPTDTEMLTHATWSLAQQPVKAVAAIRRTVEVALRVREQNRGPSFSPPPTPFSAPATSINGPLTSERSFAALTGCSPIPASSGKTHRHRLNRGGDRQANAALWRIAIVRMASDERSQKYIAKRISEGKSKIEAIRCLKRYIAREVFDALPQTAAA